MTMPCGCVADGGPEYTAELARPRSTRDPLVLGRWFQDEVIIVAVHVFRSSSGSVIAIGDVRTHASE